MKILILALLLPLTSFAYDSNEEIDALKLKPYLQQMVKKADKTCRSNFAPESGRDYADLVMLEYGRKNCGDKLVDSLKDCSDVPYTCEKPSMANLQGEFDDFKVKAKAVLAKKQAKKARQDHRKALKAKQEDEDLSNAELNEIQRSK